MLTSGDNRFEGIIMIAHPIVKWLIGVEFNSGAMNDQINWSSTIVAHIQTRRAVAIT